MTHLWVLSDTYVSQIGDTANHDTNVAVLKCWLNNNYYTVFVDLTKIMLLLAGVLAWQKSCCRRHLHGDAGDGHGLPSLTNERAPAMLRFIQQDQHQLSRHSSCLLPRRQAHDVIAITQQKQPQSLQGWSQQSRSLNLLPYYHL